MKIIFDTNVWIYFLISKKFEVIYNLLKNNIITIVYSEELLDEINLVSKRKKFKKYFEEEDVINIIDLLKKYGIKIHIKSNINICRDRKDNFILNLAVDSDSDFVITGDNDLLVLNQIAYTKIIKYSEFEFILKDY
jgi:hypothetical protein